MDLIFELHYYIELIKLIIHPTIVTPGIYTEFDYWIALLSNRMVLIQSTIKINL